MGAKPAQADLNAALKSIFRYIPKVHLIQDDLIIATESTEEHLEAICETMEVIKSKNLTLKPNKSTFGSKKIKFWGILFSSEGVKADPEKIKPLEDLQSPKNKEERNSLIYMMQCNSNFILNLSKSVALLRILLNSKEHFKWTMFHQNVFISFCRNLEKRLY